MTPSLKAKVREIDKILKALPEIKERLSKDNSWESIKSLCQPLGLTDTAFRDNPRVNDYLLSEKYWQDRLKKLLPKGKPQSPQPVWAGEFDRKYEDFIHLGGWKGSREKGKARFEGRDYVVQDGDVVEFKIGK